MNRDFCYPRPYENELAKAYVPFQIMNQTYSQEEALKKGTLFPELYKPYRIGNKTY